MFEYKQKPVTREYEEGWERVFGKRRMKICLYTEKLPMVYWWDSRFPVRGTERFYVETANWLREFGHDVWTVKEGRLNDCELPRYGDPKGYDVILACNYMGEDFLHKQKGKVVYWSDRPDERRFLPTDVQEVIAISDYHKSLLNDTFQNVTVVKLGVDKRVFFPKGEKENLAVYTSSPDRGWHGYLETLAPVIRKMTGWDVVTSGYGGWTEEKLVDALQRAKLWLHPGRGVELFCLAGAEAQACGAWPVIVPTGALPETCPNAYQVTDGDYGQRLVEVIKHYEIMKPEVNANHIMTWEQSTRKLEEALCR